MAFSKSLIAFALTMAMALAAASAQNTAQDFVSLHNQARATVGVDPVVWDATLAKYAYDYAVYRSGDCLLLHSEGPYGENLFWGSAGWEWSALNAVEWWMAEETNYHYSTDTCDVGKVCEHYKQVVWSKTTSIGCARVVCAANLGVFIICNYYPRGNIIGERPFAARP